MRAFLMMLVASQCVALSMTRAQDSLKERATAEMVAYLARSEADLGDFYLLVDVAMQTTPDSSKNQQYAMRYEKLVLVEEKIRYEDLHRQSIYPPEEKNGGYNLPCRKVQFWKNDQLYKKLSVGTWIKIDQEAIKADPRKGWTYCHFHDIFDWPFLEESKLGTNKPDHFKFSLEWPTCHHAALTRDGLLVSEWYRADGEGYGKRYFKFRDGVPVHYEQIGFTGPIGDKKTDLSKKFVLASVETTWKDFDEFKLPTKIFAALSNGPQAEIGDITYLVDVKIDWKFGEDIPKNLIEEINKIAETTK